MTSESNDWTGKSVLVTGVTGTVGQEVLRQLVALGAGQISGIDINETDLFFLGQQYRHHGNIRLTLGDIRDRDTMMEKMQGVDVVIHTAALKHVGLCENSPRDAVNTNVTGIMNVIDAAVARGVKRVVNTSSDKAVNPTNVMGTSKLMGERLFSAAQWHYGAGGPRFISTRFGNVLGSRGSVVPLFKRQIRDGGPITITDERMSRFIMSLDDSVQLVLRAAMMGDGGEVFVTKMPVAMITDIARVMIDDMAPLYGHKAEDIAIETIGSRPGEKLYEELLSDEEVRRSVDTADFLIAFPAITWGDGAAAMERFQGTAATKPYISSTEEPLTQEQVREYFNTHGLLDPAIS